MWQKYSEKIYLKKRKRRVAISTLVIFVLIPLTVYVGIHYWNDYNFMLVSVLILLYVMAPFFMMFERKKPRARELVLVAVMTALHRTWKYRLLYHDSLSGRDGDGDHVRNCTGTGGRVPCRRAGPLSVQFLSGTGALDAVADVLLGDSWILCGACLQ